MESAAAAKCALEQHFHNLIMDPVSPRSKRRAEFEQYLIKLGLTHDERDAARQQWNRSESNHLRQVRVLKSSSLARQSTKGVTIAGFNVLRVIGKGSFGVVRLVNERSVSVDNAVELSLDESGAGQDNSSIETTVATVDGTANCDLSAGKPLADVFAMKVIRKSDMLRASQEGHLRAERDFLVGAENSRWAVPLMASFQDNTNLYLVMEYMIGGDFLGLLLREDVLEEHIARWYVAEMILCIEEAHRMKWIHRDIKPDNFLISASGHLKISDFGLAFNGHWAHSQTYYKNQRETLLERVGITISGDEQDVAESTDGADDGPKCQAQANRPRFRVDAEECARREGLLHWRDRTERRKLARSVVGTSQYMSPEVILGQPYDGRCD